MATVTINGLTYNTVIMPSTPAAPAGLEFQHTPLCASSMNPFTGQVIAYQWTDSNGNPVAYKEVSVRVATLTNSDAQPWLDFLEELSMVNVFCFPPSVCSQYPNELLTGDLYDDPRYFRLKGGLKWSVSPGGIYNGVIFEAQEVL